MSKNEKTVEMWNAEENTTERYGKGFHWVESPQVAAYIQRKMTGNPKLSWGTYVIQKYLQKNKGKYTGLSLGCGAGVLEVQLQKEKIFKHLDAVDIADKAIEGAKELAKKAHVKVNFFVDDLNNMKLEKEKYDVIFANSVLHHLENLEFVYAQIRKSLKSDGYLFLCEYVGPSQFQYTSLQIALVNSLLEQLPEKYKKRVSDKSIIKQTVYPPSREYMNQIDPSEAVRSEEVVPLLRQYLTEIECHDFGGTLLHTLLQDIAGNFNPRDEAGNVLIKNIISIEDILIQEKVLKSDFTFMIFQKRTGIQEKIRIYSYSVKNYLFYLFNRLLEDLSS